MSNRLEAISHLAGQAVRTGWYATLYQLTNRRIAGLNRDRKPPRVQLTRPVPATRELLRDVLRLQALDAANVRDGIYPAPSDGDGSLTEHIRAVRMMFADLAKSNERRIEGRAD